MIKLKRQIKLEKIDYPASEDGSVKAGIGGSMWIPLGVLNEECKDTLEPCDDDDCSCSFGSCFDFNEDDVDVIIDGLKQWKEMEAVKYEPDEDYDLWQKKQAILEKKWYYKVWDWAKDLAITVRPFDWSFGIGKMNWLSYKMPSFDSRGVIAGPIQLTIPQLWKSKDRKDMEKFIEKNDEVNELPEKKSLDVIDKAKRDLNIDFTTGEAIVSDIDTTDINTYNSNHINEVQNDNSNYDEGSN